MASYVSYHQQPLLLLKIKIKIKKTTKKTEALVHVYDTMRTFNAKYTAYHDIHDCVISYVNHNIFMDGMFQEKLENIPRIDFCVSIAKCIGVGRGDSIIK